MFASISPELHVRASPNFLQHVTYGLGSVSLWWCYDTLRTSGITLDIFVYNGLTYGGMSIPSLRVTSLCRRTQANAPAPPYWLRRVLDDGGRRD